MRFSNRSRTTRRDFLIGLVAGSVASGMARCAGEVRAGAPGTAGAGEVRAAEPQSLAAAREQAAKRRRRIIYNNDGDDIWAAGADTVEKFLDLRHAPLLDTGVDSICYCTTQSFNLFTHDTRVAEIFKIRSSQFAGNNLPAFLEQKTDGLRMSSEFARRHGLESLWTLRMNDIHDAWTPELVSDWKRQDARRIMSTLEETSTLTDRRRLWSQVDFEHPDVEPRLLEIVREVLRGYDIDGVELDFLRAPIYFRTTYEGQPATDAQRDVLTRLVRRIRALVIEESERQGKPLLLASRIPSTVADCRRIGIDVNAWLEEKLLDFLSLGGGYITFDLPARELIELGHRHGLPVYPCLSQSGLMYRPPRGDSEKQPPEAWFGAASRLWADGADGMYTFNLFPGEGAADAPAASLDQEYARRVLTMIGSPDALRATTIQYALSDAGWWMPAHFWAKDAEEFSGALPLTLKPDDFTQTFMVVPEDLRGADIDVTAELRVDFTGLTENSRPTILFGSANFGPQSGGEQIAQVRRYVCQVPLQAITQGKNRVMVKVEEPEARLAGVELWIRRG